MNTHFQRKFTSTFVLSDARFSSHTSKVVCSLYAASSSPYWPHNTGIFWNEDIQVPIILNCILKWSYWKNIDDLSCCALWFGKRTLTLKSQIWDMYLCSVLLFTVNCSILFLTDHCRKRSLEKLKVSMCHFSVIMINKTLAKSTLKFQ